MKAILYILFVQCITESSLKTTLSQKERVKILRQKLTEEIRSKTKEKTLFNPLDTEDSSIEEKMNDLLPITPIMENTEKYKTRALTTVKFDSENGGNAAIDKSQDGGQGKGNETFSRLRSPKRIHRNKVRAKIPLEIFYRRIYDKDLFDKQLEWLHCQDIITPFLTGAKLNISNPKVLGQNDPTVLRLISLLKVNTSTYGREEIYSILFQISNLNLRFFRWDVNSMKMLFNVITKDKRHTFGNLKSGLRNLFHNWRLDFSNSTALLRQARIFRPPCVYVANNDGSTKSPKVTKYPKKMKPTSPCDREDNEDDCKE